LWTSITGHEDKLHVVYNGIDLEEFSGKPLRTGEGIFRIVSIGRLSKEKRFDEGVRIARSLRGRGHRVSYEIVGDGPCRSQLENLIVEQRLGDTVRLTGKLRHGEVRALLATADVLLHPGIDESFGMVIGEAMAAFRPVVAARSGGVPELVSHGETGFLFDPGNEEQAITYLDTLVKDRKMAAWMGGKGREKVASEFSWDLHVRQMSRIWESVARSGKQ
jgi:glycosyltransferase involved in cell wall biosynthesis